MACVNPTIAVGTAWPMHSGTCGMPILRETRYLLLRSADNFYDERGYYPGYTNETLANDELLMRSHIDSVLRSFGLPPQMLSKAHVSQNLRRE